MKFLNGETVIVKATGVEGVIHHGMKFPNESWKYAVDFENGDRLLYLEGELVFTDKEEDHA